jgi:hypothetical protein
MSCIPHCRVVQIELGTIGTTAFQLLTFPVASNMPRWISLRREKPRQTTRLPGGRSLARVR